MAISLPKFRLKDTAPIRGSVRLRALMRSRVSSRLPSSTKTTSQVDVIRFRTGRRRSHRGAMLALSLWTGMMTLSLGDATQ